MLLRRRDMNTFMLILFIVSMLAGLVSLILLILSFVNKKFKPNRKKYGVLFVVFIVVFFTSVFGYEATLTNEERQEIAHQQETQEREKLEEESKKSKQEIVSNAEKETANSDVEDSISKESTTYKSNTTEQIKNSDLEIITREGHPTYYGSVKSSHNVWKDVKKNKIIFADSYDNYKDTTILSMSAYRNSDLIRGISVNFNNFEEPCKMTVKEVLPIIASYMPYDIMDKYYQFDKSESIQPDEGKDGEYYYVISYNLTDSEKKAYDLKEHEYSGTIDVIICANKEGIVENFDINFGTPRWMSSLSTNSYHQVEWNCNLYDYR